MSTILDIKNHNKTNNLQCIKSRNPHLNSQQRHILTLICEIYKFKTSITGLPLGSSCSYAAKRALSYNNHNSNTQTTNTQTTSTQTSCAANYYNCTSKQGTPSGDCYELCSYSGV
jgi:hypothetical protein